MPTAAARQRGVGLLEVLLAVVVVSIGFLSVARMQMEGMRASREAYALSQARLMLTDMTERMRANRPGLASGAYDALDTAADAAPPDCTTNGVRCTPAELARADLHAWSARLHGTPGESGFVPLLPSGADVAAAGRVRRDGTDGWSVTLEWYDAASDAMRSIATRVIR